MEQYKQIGIANLQLLCHNNNWQYMTTLEKEKGRNSSHEAKTSGSSCEMI